MIKSNGKLYTRWRITTTERVSINGKLSINAEIALKRNIVRAFNTIVFSQQVMWKEGIKMFPGNPFDRYIFLWKIMMDNTSLILYELFHVTPCLCMSTFKLLDGMLLHSLNKITVISYWDLQRKYTSKPFDMVENLHLLGNIYFFLVGNICFSIALKERYRLILWMVHLVLSQNNQLSLTVL